jgi:glucose/arabinose dehydrogenase
MRYVRPHRFVSSLPLLLLFACASDTDAPVQPVTPVTPVAPVTDPPVLTRSVVESGLSAPWDVAISSDGTLFYTERCAGLSVRRANGTRARLFGTTGSALVAPDLFCLGQSGMNGVALDPGFATNRLVYVFWSQPMPSTRLADGVSTRR